MVRVDVIACLVVAMGSGPFCSFARATESAAPEPAACPWALGGSFDVASLEPTGWRSGHGTYGLLDVSGVFEATDAEGRKHYVFASRNGPSRVFRALARDYQETKSYLKAYGDGGGSGLRVIERLVLREITDAKALDRSDVAVRVENEDSGFRLERWTFELDGRAQRLSFYDPEAEQRNIARKAREREAREQWLRDNPDPGSKPGIRKAIVDGILAQGLDPGQQMWIDEEVERQWAEMWHDITR